MKEWGNALQGLGAWWGGRGPQYEEVKRREAEDEQARRRQAMIDDTMVMASLVESGNRGDLLRFVNDRRDAIIGLGGSTDHTDRIMRGLMSSNPQEVQAAEMDILRARDVLAPQKQAFNPQIKDGHLIQPDGMGGAVATPVAGLPSGPAHDTEQETRLRKEYGDLAKSYEGINDSFGRILASIDKPSGAGDMALIFNYMKMLDPGSTVREGEFATASATGTWGDRIEGARQQVISGKRLSEDQRADFANRAARLYEEATTLYDQRTEGFKHVISQYPSARPEAILRDRALYRDWRDKYSLPSSQDTGTDDAPASSQLTADEAAELEALRAWAAGRGAPSSE